MSEESEFRDKRIVIVGAGPAGLAAAYDLCQRGYSPLVIEADDVVGGIAKTLNHNGNRIDLGGHRFFTHNEQVDAWWSSFITMMERPRLSHIYYLRKFFDYPVALNWTTLSNLGFWRTIQIGLGYLAARLRPVHPEESLEDFMVNRFGRPLYEMFFRDYTEKLWGVPCNEIGADWGAQRIRGISVGAALLHAVSAPFAKGRRGRDVQASLIGQFHYPQHGPGQLWEAVAERVERLGGTIQRGSEVVAVNFSNGRVESVTVRDGRGADRIELCDTLMSTMPVRDLVLSTQGISVPDEVVRVASGLPYRDFMTCGLLVPELTRRADDGGPLRDNWIYIQESDVTMGRLQIFNNWSPYMVADEGTTWVGTEYFCDQGDELWTMPDDEFAALAALELAQIGLIREGDVLDSVVIRVKKAYPAYFGTFAEMDIVRTWLDSVPNLFVMGRNGTHRYNNMDHSVASAWAAVRAAMGEASRAEVWRVNTEEEYHES